MIVLIVGPSGIGKTSAYEAIQDEFPTCHFEHLDGLASRWAMKLGIVQREDVNELRRRIGDDQLFLAFGLEAIGHLAGQTGKHVVIDVGAGFQDARSAESLGRIHEVIVITAEPAVAYERFLRRGPRDRAEYTAVEFSEHRRRVYGNAGHVIDTTTLTLDQTARQLVGILRTLLRL